MVFNKAFLGVAITGDHTHCREEANSKPRQIHLIREEAASRAARIKVVIIVPLSSDIPWPKLIDREIVPMEVDAYLSSILAAPMTFEVEGSDTDRPDS